MILREWECTSSIVRAFHVATSAHRISPNEDFEYERAAKNRQVIERPGDIVYLKELATISRPVHSDLHGRE